MESQKLSLDRLTIINTQPQYAEGICRTVRRAFHVDLDEECDDCMTTPSYSQHRLSNSPKDSLSQSMRKTIAVKSSSGWHQPCEHLVRRSEKAVDWMSAIGNLSIKNHEPNGDWLYGVEMAVRPMYHRNGIGTRVLQKTVSTGQRLKFAWMVRSRYAYGL